MQKTTLVALCLTSTALLTAVCQARKRPAKLNVFIDGKEVSRFLYDIDSTLYLVRDSKVAAMLKRPLSYLVPPIEPAVKEIKFKFNSIGKVRYTLSFKSSNVSVMRHPRASIPMTGFVPRRTKGFRISFPCTGRLSGEVFVHINISFSDRNGRKMVWGPLSITLRRQCRYINGKTTKSPVLSQRTSAVTGPVPSSCNKKCSKNYILRKFCLSDYVIRAKVESEVRKNGRLQLRVRVTRKFKIGKVRITKRQLLELRGRELTCNCSQVIPKKVYLILGKEDRQRKVLYVDNFVTALEWYRSGRRMLRMHRRKRNHCPIKILP